jgi:hypothetical protein
MPSKPTSGAGNAAAIQERMARVQVGMEVEDAAGERIGKIADIRIGDPDAIDVGGQAPGSPLNEGFALAIGAHREPNVPAGLVERLLRAGYIKIDDKRHFRPDHHYYAMADEIVSVEADMVRLGKACRELIASLD